MNGKRTWLKRAMQLSGAIGLGVACLWLFQYLDHLEYSYQQPGIHQTQLDEQATSAGPFLQSEEMVTISSDKGDTDITLPVEPVLFRYVKVTDSCAIHYQGECLNVRSGPGLEYEVVEQLRNDIVLKVGGQVKRETGEVWYKIVFDEHLRYPERVTSDWYVSAAHVEVLLDEGDKTSWEDGFASTTKRIVVHCDTQTLFAYEGDDLFMMTEVSTGLQLTPTPHGTFTVYKKTPSRYMQGPLPSLPSDQYYDMPGVPWNLYFTTGGAVIHGAYWHDSFGHPYSHGCVNLPPEAAKTLYDWAPLGTEVIVTD